MEIPAEQIVNGLLEEVKRLTLENVALKATLMNQGGADAAQETNS